MIKEDFADVLGAMTERNDGVMVPLPESWMQGRTSFGGLSAGILLGAVTRVHEELPPLRSALINFTGPLSEAPLISNRILRRGRNVTTVEARGTVGDQTAMLGTFSFGTAQESHITVDCPAPMAPPPERCEPMIPPQAASLAPKFHTKFDIHLIEGDRPVCGSDRGYIRGWARHRDPASREGIASLLCIADILPPAIFPMFKKPGPNSSMSWICNFLREEPSTKDGWWHVESVLSAAREGYSSQVMRVWNTDGDLVVDGMQSVVVFV